MLTVPITPLDAWTARRLGVDHLTRPAVERWQLAQLREVVAWARERSPFYRHLYRDLPDGAPQSLDGLAHLPFVAQSALRDHGMELVCVSLGDISRVVTVPTSGSTGPSKRVWFTDEDLELTIDHFRHGMRALVEPGDRVLVLMPGKTPGSVGALLEEGLRRDGIEADSYGFVDDCRSVADRILEYQSDCLVGVPGQILRLARSDAGRSIPCGRLRSVLFSGDDVAITVRKAVEAAWDCRGLRALWLDRAGSRGCRAVPGFRRPSCARSGPAVRSCRSAHRRTSGQRGRRGVGGHHPHAARHASHPLSHGGSRAHGGHPVPVRKCAALPAAGRGSQGRPGGARRGHGAHYCRSQRGRVRAPTRSWASPPRSTAGRRAIVSRFGWTHAAIPRAICLPRWREDVRSIPSVGHSGIEVVVEASRDGASPPPSAKQKIVDSRRAA